MFISRGQATLFLGGALLFMLLFFVGPMLLIVWGSLQSPSGDALANYKHFFSDAYYWRVLVNTLTMSMWATLITFVLGYTLSYYMNFHVKSPLVRRAIYIIVVLPLFTSNIVRSFGWIVLLGREGIINQTMMATGLTSGPVQLLYTNGSIIVALAYVMLPFMILTLNSIFQNINPSVIEASRDLGAGPIVTFLKVTFPLSLPGVVAGSLIVFTLCVSAYVTPSIMSGGRVTVMPVLIYDYYMVQLDFGMGATLAVVLLATTIAIIGGYMFILRRYSQR
ncbi:ABC transporter permease [Escherichia coli]|nr:ABC transporter permease [Salmonella enterica subsp. enterica]EFG2885961.1 ABC transporter permease [Escherichia coli]MIL09185.1 ABC transporter permease [Salmonella enterica subsp. enterica serovar Enteritidis]